jgi:hypothetical protein
MFVGWGGTAAPGHKNLMFQSRGEALCVAEPRILVSVAHVSLGGVTAAALFVQGLALRVSSPAVLDPPLVCCCQLRHPPQDPDRVVLRWSALAS